MVVWKKWFLNVATPPLSTGIMSAQDKRETKRARGKLMFCRRKARGLSPGSSSWTSTSRQ